MVPYPDPVVIAVLASLTEVSDAVDDRISTALDSVLPAIRLAKVGDLESPSDWEATPLYQIEVWSADEIEAGLIAWAIKNAWPTARRQVVGDALVTSRWVEIDPRSLPDTDNDTVADTGTDFARYLLTVGIRLSGAPTT